MTRQPASRARTTRLTLPVAALLLMFALPARAQSPGQLSRPAGVPFEPWQRSLPSGVADAQSTAALGSRSMKASTKGLVSAPPLFLPAATYGSGGATNFALADVNGDGKLDLVGVGNETISVLLGNGDGTFQPAISTNWYFGDIASVLAVDVNGDGKPDLVLLITFSISVSVMLGNGDGTFQPPVSYSFGGSDPDSVAVADVNGDGKPDIVVADFFGVNSGQSSLMVLLGNGDGTFQPAVPYYAGGDAASAVVIADVNGDGKPDLVDLNSCQTYNCYPTSDGVIGVLLGNGDGTFQPAVTYDSGGPGGPWTQLTPLAVADVNHDGKPDLVIANAGAGGYALAVLLGNGDGTFQPAVTYDSAGAIPDAIAIVDVNSDGKPDLLAVNNCTTLLNGFYCSGEGSLAVLLGNGDGTFQPALTFDPLGPSTVGIAVADLNGDGKPEVVTLDPGIFAVFVNNTGAPTTTTLTSSARSTVYGQTVTFTAAVTSDSGTPTGTVALVEGSTTVGTGTLSSGKVSIPVSSLPAGSNLINAFYQGATGQAPSLSAKLNQTVTPATTTTLLTSSANPVGNNDPVTLAAAVASQYGGAVTGTVTFTAPSQTTTYGVFGGVADWYTSFSKTGTYPISAQYSGDANNTGSTSLTLNQVVLTATTTTLASSVNPSSPGQPVTFTAVVSASAGIPPNGEVVTFYNGSSVLGTGSLTGGAAAFTTSSLPSGVYIVTASYPGDSNFVTSSSPSLRQVVNATTRTPTSITLTSSLNPSIYGEGVLLTVTVTGTGPVPPGGVVSVSWPRSNIGTATLNTSSVATLTETNLNADLYPLTAVYKGDVNNLGSSSAVLNQVVTETTSSATLTSSPNPSTVGQEVTFTAILTSPTVRPTGPVTFTLGKTVLASVELSGGKAKFTTSTLPAGSNVITVTYSGDSNIAKSSASVTQVVEP